MIHPPNNKWAAMATQLQEHIAIYKTYPTKTVNKRLYKWVHKQRYLKKRAQLPIAKITYLDAIDFIWNPVAYKWQQDSK